MNKTLFSIFLLLHALAVKGQGLRGSVRDGESGMYLNAVLVANESTRQSTYSNKNGEFSLSGKKGDVITFSLVGYKTQQKTVPAAIGIAEMKVDLFRFSFQLDEFILRPKYTPYQLDSIERHSTYQRALAREKSGSIMSPVTFIAEKLSKRSRRIFRFQKSFNYWEDQKFIESRYTPELVQQLTKLQGDTLAWFINANPIASDYARVASELELKMWIRDNYKAWLKNPQYPPLIQDSSITNH